MNDGVQQKKPWIDVRYLRVKRGWSQEESAKRLGIRRAHLSLIETGKCGFSLKTINAIIEVYGVQYEDFYSDTGSDTSSDDTIGIGA